MSEFDIDTAHRVPIRNQNGRGRATGRPFLIICKFTRRIARDGVLAKRKETRRLLPESFDLLEDSELSIKIYTQGLRNCYMMQSPFKNLTLSNIAGRKIQ